MNFKIKKPCQNIHCPFRKDCLKGWLGRKRATEIGVGIFNDQTFACHKTTDGEAADHSHCAGALILQGKVAP